VDRDRVRDLLEQESLIQTTMDTSQIMRIRENMERANARRLQPHYIKAFFLQAFEHLGGTLHERERGRYAINNVPAAIRNYARERGLGEVSVKYERICFEKSLINLADKVPATFVCPGHPLLDAIIGLLLDRDGELLKRGGVLIDETDPGQTPCVLLYLEQAIQDATPGKTGERHTISREMHFVEIGSDGEVREAGGAPYLDYRPATAQELAQMASLKIGEGFGMTSENTAMDYAIEQLVPRHLDRVSQQRIELIDKTEAAVQERLTKEINYWDLRAADLRTSERAGKINARLNSQLAAQRADSLTERLKQRKIQLAQERQISATPPIVMGGALIVPIGLLLGDRTPAEIMDRRITEQIAMQAVMHTEIALGHDPHDVSAQNVGYDIESRDGHTGHMRFIEVKGRRAEAETVTITRNEILAALNTTEQFILALVIVEDGRAHPARYIRQPFQKEPDFNVTSVNYNLRDLLNMSEEPR